MMVIIREIRWIKNINFICSQSSLKDNVKHTKKLKSLFEEKKKKNPAGIRASQITKQEGVRSTLQRRARRKTFREKGEGRKARKLVDWL